MEENPGNMESLRDVTPAYFITFSGTMSGERVEVLGGSDSTQARVHTSQKTRAGEEILAMPLNEPSTCCLLVIVLEQKVLFSYFSCGEERGKKEVKWVWEEG